jgi:cell division protein FtsW (lipid II flippase)
LPAATTDFVWATVGEETGIWGSFIVLGVLAGIVFRLLYLARMAKTRFDMLLLFGVGSWIGIQTCVNVMMANAFLPAIGIPLPFISSGGSSLVALWMALGACQATLAPVSDKGDSQKYRTAQSTAMKVPSRGQQRRVPSSTTINKLQVTGNPESRRRG